MKSLAAAAIGLAIAIAPLELDAKPPKAEGFECTRGGKIKRSGRERAEFERANPYPSTGRPSGGCPGHVIDHVFPLKRGGADKPHNMPWQTTAEASEKDRWE